MVALRQLLSLTRLTAIDVIRQPIFLLLTNACVILAAVIPMVLLHKFGEEGKLVRDSGLAFHFAFGFFIAGFTAGSSLVQEIEMGTASSILSKPVSRSGFFIAKLLGLGLSLVAFSMCAGLSTLISERVAERYILSPNIVGDVIDWQTGWFLFCSPFVAMCIAGLLNYYGHRPFTSTAFFILFSLLLVCFCLMGCFDRMGNFSSFNFRVQWRILPASILVSLALFVLCSIALSLSTRLRTAQTLIVCFGIFVLGMISDYWFGGVGGESTIARFLYGVTPNWQHFWRVDALSSGGKIPWIYVGHAFAYAGTYSAAVLLFGILSFRNVDIR